MPKHKTHLSIALFVAVVACIVLPSCSPVQKGLLQWQPAQRTKAACLAKRESGNDPSAISPTHDYGLWQINRKAHKATFERMYGKPFETKALDPVLNGKYAAYLYSVAGWSPWAGGRYSC